MSSADRKRVLRVLSAIMRANGGVWPSSLGEWRNVCKRYGMRIEFQDYRGAVESPNGSMIAPPSGYSLPGLMIVQDGLDHWWRSRVIIHELTEMLARRLQLTKTHQEAHELACLCELYA